MRKNLDSVEVMRRNGIDFVPIPAGGQLTKGKLLVLMMNQLSDLEKEATNKQ